MMNTERQNQDESQRRSLQEYIFSLEEAKKEAEDPALKHEQSKRTEELLNAIMDATSHGIALVKEILKIRPDMPIILCTGFSEKINDEKAKTLGIHQYIEKPINRRDLAKLVRQVLDEKKLSLTVSWRALF